MSPRTIPHRLAMLVLVLLTAFPAASLAQVPSDAPPEVSALRWCPGASDCLEWTPVAGAEDYTVHRGSLATVQNLLSQSPDTCVAGFFVEPTSGPVLDDPPPPTGYWYLVAARNAAGEGSSGEGSAGPRSLESNGPCAGAGGAALVLNEIDYDQPGADDGEFVEIYNAGDVTADLTGLAVVLVNGSSAAEYARVALDAAGSLGPGAFLVLGSSSVLAALPAGVAGLPLPGSIQNGAPDGVALFDAAAGRLLGALSYEGEIRDATFDGAGGGFDLVEGRPATAADATNGSLVRFPDGTDTDDAEADWGFVGIPTPGAPNGDPGS